MQTAASIMIAGGASVAVIGGGNVSVVGASLTLAPNPC
jgi:hypothetical protein